MRIAMWSGPRNLSTAMMYSFGNRADFAAWDEPFYAPYLHATGIEHPMSAEIIESHETDPTIVAQKCLGSIPDGKPHFYMKHMPHHMITGFPMDWAKGCVNIHLIRHPARVAASYAQKRDEMTLEDIGFGQQHALHKSIGGLIVDSADIRLNPEGMLRAICDKIELPFDEAMLNWPTGPKAFDGVWAQHWYNAVHKSSGFAGPEGELPILSGKAAEIVEQALPSFEALERHKLTV